jgi:hypothetical protein
MPSALAIALLAAAAWWRPAPAAAQTPTTFRPGVGIPGSAFQAGTEVIITPSTVGEYIRATYTFGVYAAATLAVVVLMFGGYLWLTSGGSVERAGRARAFIGGAISGLVLLLLSWTLLLTINPNLVRFAPLNVPGIAHETLLNREGCGNYPLAALPNVKDDDAFAYVERPGSCLATPAGFKCLCLEPRAGAKTCCYGQRQLGPGERSRCSGALLCVERVTSVSPSDPCPEELAGKLTVGSGVTCEQALQEFSVPLCSQCAATP